MQIAYWFTQDKKSFQAKSLKKLVQPVKTPHNGSASFCCLLWISEPGDLHQGWNDDCNDKANNR